MQILLLDIETSPTVAYVWGTRLFNAFIDDKMIVEPTRILCWAAKWLGNLTIYSAGEWHGRKTMLKALHKLVSEADVVVTHNGKRFDIPHINREFLLAGMPPPPPYKQVDTKEVVKRTFKFDHNGLDPLVRQLDLGQKMETGGIELWKKVLAGDKEAQTIMRDYNIQDVVILEKLYTKIRPWIEKHPNHGAYDEKQCCPKCGSTSFQRRGTAITNIARYVRYQCKACGGWFRSSINLRPSGDKTRNVQP